MKKKRNKQDLQALDVKNKLLVISTDEPLGDDFAVGFSKTAKKAGALGMVIISSKVTIHALGLQELEEIVAHIKKQVQTH
jgi:hypothetical protein